MERHLRSRRARGRLALAAALCGAAACVPLAPFERPESPSAAHAEGAATAGPAKPPDLPERVERPAQEAPPEAAPTGAPETAPTETAAGSPAVEATVSEPPAAQTPQEAPAPVPVAPEAAEEPLQTEVRAVLESFYADYNVREWKRARLHFWNGATITDVRRLPDGSAATVQVASVDAFFEELARTPESPQQGFEGRLAGTPQVRTASNVAQAWCLFQASFGGPQESMSWRRVDAFTFVLHEGSWKIASLAQSRSFDAPVDR